MNTDKAKQDKPDGSQVSADLNYEAQDYQRKLGITTAEARQMLKSYGNNREALERHVNLA